MATHKERESDTNGCNKGRLVLLGGQQQNCQHEPGKCEPSALGVAAPYVQGGQKHLKEESLNNTCASTKRSSTIPASQQCRGVISVKTRTMYLE